MAYHRDTAGKHAQAEHALILLVLQGDVLHLRVQDDGIGGALVTTGGGLHGLERRLAAFDGSLHVHSPAGGPTVVDMQLPCTSVPAVATEPPALTD